MNVENEKAEKLDESEVSKQMVDKSRRSFAKAGVVAPVIMTLVSKTALGETPYHCTVSGQHSGNHSGRHDWQTPCGVGFSPGAWKTPGDSGDGSIDQWLAAGVNPMKIDQWQHPNAVYGIFAENSSAVWKTGNDKTFGNLTAKNMYLKINAKGFSLATKFNSKFGGGDTRSFHDILMTEEGSLKFHAIADYLNAALNQSAAYAGIFSPVYDNITPQYIVNVYNDASMSDDAKKNYFILIHH
jgi:hypothetical protein